MQRKIAFLLNPVSGTREKSALRYIVEEQTKEKGIAFEFFPTNAAGQYPELEKCILSKEITDIVVIGGDGSISQVTAALRHTRVPFGIIPAGSGNGLALAAGISRNTEKALQVIFNGEARPIDAFMINGHFSCMLSGIGFDAKVAHDFASQKTRGLSTYVKVSARNFFTAKPWPFILSFDGKEINTEAYFISIANGNQFGNQFTIAPKARLNDGLIDIVVVQRMNKLQLLISVLHQLRFGDVNENIFRKHSILYFQCKAIGIKNPGLAPLHIDGDPCESSDDFSIQVIPEAFQLIQPVH